MKNPIILIGLKFFNAYNSFYIRNFGVWQQYLDIRKIILDIHNAIIINDANVLEYEVFESLIYEIPEDYLNESIIEEFDIMLSWLTETFYDELINLLGDHLENYFALGWRNNILILVDRHLLQEYSNYEYDLVNDFIVFVNYPEEYSSGANI
jgi:hypothetical protein